MTQPGSDMYLDQWVNGRRCLWTLPALTGGLRAVTWVLGAIPRLVQTPDSPRYRDFAP
jgi:hypothetical protein